MAERGSVSHWLQQARDGGESAALRLWSRYRERMRRFARTKIDTSSSAVADEDDVVICAFESFLRRVREGGYPQLQDRAELWRLLAAITMSKALKQRRDLNRPKRAGSQDAESLYQANGGVRETLCELACPSPSPDLLASLNDSLEHLLGLLESDELREIALAKMHGSTNPEIAEQINRSLPTVERRLCMIRSIWQTELVE